MRRTILVAARRDPTLVRALGIFLALNLTDILTTAIGLRLGGGILEQNPLARPFLAADFAELVAIKLGLAATISAVLLLLAPAWPRVARIQSYAWCALGGIIVIGNLLAIGARLSHR